jgi:hypothetical protein
MVDMIDPNTRSRITHMLAAGGQARQQAVAEIMKGPTGVEAFDSLAEGMRRGQALQANLKATRAKPVAVNYVGPMFSRGKR